MRFYIGQRVRIKWSPNHPDVIGTEGTVLSDFIYGENDDGSRYDGYLVGPDVWGGVPDCPYDFAAFCPFPDQLEPIQPEGWKKITWKEMEDLWSPPILTSSDAMA